MPLRALSAIKTIWKPPDCKTASCRRREMRLSHEMNVKLMQTTRQSRRLPRLSLRLPLKLAIFCCRCSTSPPSPLLPLVVWAVTLRNKLNMGVNLDSLCFVYFFFSLPYNEVVSVFNRHGPRQRRTTKTDSQHWNNKRYRNIQCSIYRQWRTMAFGKGQTLPEEGQRLLNNTQRTQRSPPLSPFATLVDVKENRATRTHAKFHLLAGGS